MGRGRLIWKLLAGYAALVLLTTTLVALSVLGRMEHDLRAATESSLTTQARLATEICRPALLGTDLAGVRAKIAALGAESGTRFTVIATDGTVLADSESDPQTMNNHGLRPEMVQSREQGIAAITRYSQTVDEYFMYVALAVDQGPEQLGWVRTAVSLTSINTKISRMRNYIGLAALLAILLGVALGYVIARHLTEPLRKMTILAQAIAEGNYDQRLPVTQADETGTLARALNRMSGSLRRRIGIIDTDRNQLRTILAGMVEGVIAVDTAEQIVHMNTAAGQILDIIAEQCIGRHTWEALRVNELTEILKDCQGQGRDLTREITLPRQTGDRWIELVASPLYDGAGQVVGSVVVVHDVTRLRQLERMRRDFVANVSHELKTPLTAIKGIIATLQDDPGMDEPTRRHFNSRIEVQADRLERLISDLLTLNRVESGHETVDFKPCDLRDLAVRVLAEYQLTAQDKRITLQSSLPDREMTVVGDLEGLHGLMSNLIDNAVKYTAAGGQVELAGRIDGQWAVIQVIDNGIGIAAEHLERVFERFYRVDQARSREVGGTGLGLSIVKNVAQSHGGKTGVDSAVGRGSTFWVRLPLAVSSTPHEG